MTTATIKGFVHYKVDGYEAGRLSLFSCDDMTTCGYVLVGPHEFEYEVPDSFNPMTAQVTALEIAIKEENKKHAERVVAIKEKIASLLCIENNPSEAACSTKTN